MTIGGEDLLLLFMPGEMGKVVCNPNFAYTWDGSNWTDTADHASLMADYTQGFMENHLDAVAAFILFQSLDRLAACSSLRPHISSSRYRRAVQDAIRSFWPVVDHRGKILYRASPRQLRVALLSTRGVGPLRARLRAMTSSLSSGASKDAQAREPGWFARVDSGHLRLSSLSQIEGELLPRLRETALGHPLVTQQVDFWESRILDIARG
jgi:hypothetical protein